mmetsp:Transcript_21304/g.26182  ORF Transcript_21304/g.26182 Transcript_21304/m.26182 type:complete len:133 (-) Transcript_21304:542-940(-)
MLEKMKQTVVQKDMESSDTVSLADMKAPDTSSSMMPEIELETNTSFSYGDFAKQYPFLNNIAITTTKTAAADLPAQTVIAQTPGAELDIQRSILFCAFGDIYLGDLQYFYQVHIFKKLFNVDKFTSQSLEEK